MKLFFFCLGLYFGGCGPIIDPASVQTLSFTFPKRDTFASDDKLVAQALQLVDSVLLKEQFELRDTDSGRFLRAYYHRIVGISVTVLPLRNGFKVSFMHRGARRISDVARNAQNDLKAKLREAFGQQIAVADES